MISAWKRLLRVIGSSRRHLALAVALGVFQSGVLAGAAFLLRRLFDDEIPHHHDNGIVFTAVALVGVGLVAGVAGLAGQRVASRLARTAVADLRKALLERLYEQPAGWHDRRDPGVLLQTIIQDTDRLTIWLGQLSSSTFPALIRAVALTVVAIILSPLLTACLAVMLPVSVLLARVLGARARDAFRRYIDAQIDFGASARVALRTLALARVHGAEGWELGRQATRVDDVLATAAVYDYANARAIGAQQSFVGVGGILALAVGGLSVSGGDMSLGNLLAFYAIGVLLLRQAALAVTGMAAARVNAEALTRIEEILDEPPPPQRAGARIEPLRGAVEFAGVGFAYDDGPPVLRGVSFAVAPGEHVALMGPSGSGKSTIVSLLLGLYQPQSGVVRVDGVALDEVDLGAYRRQVGVTLQNTVVFPGTIRENIVYGREDLPPEAVTAAMERAGLTDLIATLPDGLDHEVGEEGGLLSGGQRQRIAIARALAAEPALLVLDEPTSHLDTAAIDRLLDALEELACTIVTVTHDADVAARAARVIDLRDGAVRSVVPGSRVAELAG